MALEALRSADVHRPSDTGASGGHSTVQRSGVSADAVRARTATTVSKHSTRHRDADRALGADEKLPLASSVLFCVLSLF